MTRLQILLEFNELCKLLEPFDTQRAIEFDDESKYFYIELDYDHYEIAKDDKCWKALLDFRHNNEMFLNTNQKIYEILKARYA